jgi:ribosomal protein L11 methyltransferase
MARNPRRCVRGTALSAGIASDRWARGLWKLAVETAPEAEEAVTEWLSDAFGRPVTSYTNVDSSETRVTVFFEKKPEWSAAGRAELRAGIERIRDCGLKLGSARISLRKVRREDWAESWKRHFKPIEIDAALLIKPTWSKRRPRPGQSVVLLDPGLSFGTGQHPTTAFCLRQLTARRSDGAGRQSLLDIGTGSGILAIAAAKLGYVPVQALDLDPDAVRIARANARQNGVAGRIGFAHRDAAKMARRSGPKYSVVCANLISNVLLAERARIVGRLAPDGLLVLAGILKEEFAVIQQAYEAAGLRLVSAHTEKEWRSGSFESVACRVQNEE